MDQYIQHIRGEYCHVYRGKTNGVVYLRRKIVSPLQLILIQKGPKSYLEKVKVERPGEGFLQINVAMVYGLGIHGTSTTDC